MVAKYKNNAIAYSLLKKANEITVKGDLESVKEGLKYLKASLAFMENYGDYHDGLKLVKEQEDTIALMEFAEEMKSR